VEYCPNEVTMKLVFPITPFLHRSNTPMSILNRNYILCACVSVGSEQRLFSTSQRSPSRANTRPEPGQCEERGSGIDQVVAQVELFQLPAPIFEVPDGFTRASLLAHRPLAEMDKADRTRACYLHACLRYVTRKPMTNASVRARFGIAEKNAATASRILNDAVEAGLIVVQDTDAGTRIRRYLPFWAGSNTRSWVFT